MVSVQLIMPVKPTKFVEEPPALICPICQQIFQEPVISVKCGHTFCRLCIESMVQTGAPCPIDDIPCDSSQLVINRAVIGQIDDLMIHCCHGIVSNDGGRGYHVDPDGCQEVVKLGQRETHESICEYSKVTCPVGGEECGLLRKKDLDTHLKECSQIPCPFSDFGCFYRGDKSSVAKHKTVCVYKDESQLLAITMKELKKVRKENEELKQTLARMSKSLDKLTYERQTSTSQLEQQALAITTLTSRMDKIETEVESYKSVRLRRHHTSMPVATPMTTTPTITSSSSNIEGNHTPNYQRKSYSSDVKRWSNESSSSIASLTPVLETRREHFAWQMPFTLKCIGTFRGHKGTIWSLAVHDDKLVSSSSDGTLKVWHAADLRKGCLKTIQAHSEAAMLLGVNESSGILYSTGMDMSLRSWTLDTMGAVGVVEKAHEGTITAMICTKSQVITSSFASIKFWDPITLSEIHSIGTKEGLSHLVRTLVHDRRKNLLYSGSHNIIHVWKCGESFQLVTQLNTTFGAIYSLAVSKKYVIVGTHNQNIQVYDGASLNHIGTLVGHIGTITVLRVTESPAGVFMFSGSSDSIVQVWNLENMLPIQALQRHEKAVHSLAVLHDTLFTASEDQEIKVFKHFKL